MKQRFQGLAPLYYPSLVKWGSGWRWLEPSVWIWCSHDGYIMEKKWYSSLCNWLPRKLSSVGISANSSPSVDHQSRNDLSLRNRWRLLCFGWELCGPRPPFLILPGSHAGAFRWAEEAAGSSASVAKYWTVFLTMALRTKRIIYSKYIRGLNSFFWALRELRQRPNTVFLIVCNNIYKICVLNILFTLFTVRWTLF